MILGAIIGAFLAVLIAAIIGGTHPVIGAILGIGLTYLGAYLGHRKRV